MALREINLLPPEMLTRCKIGRHARLWCTLLIIAIVPVIGCFLFYMARVLPGTRMPISLQDSRRNLALTVAQIEAARDELERTSYLRTVAQRVRWHRVITALGTALSKQVWLSDIDIESSDETGTPLMTIKGYARTNDDLGSFLRALADTPLISEVALDFSREHEAVTDDSTAGELARQIHFGIACTVRRDA